MPFDWLAEVEPVVADRQAEVGRDLTVAEPGCWYVSGFVARKVVPQPEKTDRNSAEAGGTDTQMNLVVGLSSAPILRVGRFSNVEGLSKSRKPIVEIGGNCGVALTAMGMSPLAVATGLSVHVIHPTVFEEA